ncbi:MAG TPA: hypothetical protein PKA37_11800 [Planctomycetota bacterium]|nr:hypothetical protein [Planctomycetota bacterium]
MMPSTLDHAQLGPALLTLQSDLRHALLSGEHLPIVTTDGIHRLLAGRWPDPSLPPVSLLPPPICPFPSALSLLTSYLRCSAPPLPSSFLADS